LSDPNGRIELSTKERGWQMSANVYTIEHLLVGTQYRSRTLSGEIISAEKHPNAVWYQGCESYLVEVRPSNFGKVTCRTVAVKVEN